MVVSGAIIAVLATVAAQDPPVTFTVPRFRSATPARRIALVVAALPASAETLSVRNIASPPILDISADADGWFAKVEVHLEPVWLPAMSLCERRLLVSRLRPPALEYPMQQNTVLTGPLKAYATNVFRGYARRGIETGPNKCPSERSVHYTLADNAATAGQVLRGLDEAITRIERGDAVPSLDCDPRDGVQPCGDGLARLREVAGHVGSIYTERSATGGPDQQVHRAEGSRWTARMRFRDRQLIAVALYRTPPPPVE